ncbi:MAG: hypothetical protein Q9214_004782 [Letrouitia sp. 1 TL-2023]
MEIRNWAKLIDTHTPGVEPPDTISLRQSERRGRRWRHHKASLPTKPGVRFPWKLPVVQMPTNGALVLPARLPALPANIMRGMIRYLQRNIRPQMELFRLRRELRAERQEKERLEEDLAAELRAERQQRQRLEEELAALKEEKASWQKAHEAKKSIFNPAAASFRPTAAPPSPPPPPPPASLSTIPPVPWVNWKTGEQTMQSFQRLYPQHGKKIGE